MSAAPAIDPTVDLAARVALAGILAAAAWAKARSLSSFRAAVEGYRLLPQALVGPAAAALPVLEVAAAALLLAPGLRLAGYAAAASLLLIYSGAIAWNLLRGRREIDCGCFGAAAQVPLGPALLWRNAGLLLLAALGVLPLAARPLGAADAPAVAGAAATLLLLHAATSQLLAQAPRLRALGSRT
jgi:hypothetical protein